jgi:hypothetical protein
MYSLKYIPTENNAQKNIFTEEFYSGVDVDVFIGGAKCDFISNISYTIQEQLNPIYGYASYTYNDMSVGNRIVVGTIRVPIGSSKDLNKLVVSNNSTNSTSAEETTNKPAWVNNATNSYINNNSVMTYEQILDIFNNQKNSGSNITGK